MVLSIVQTSQLVGALYVSSLDSMTSPLCPTPRGEASTENSHVDWHLEALRVIFTTATLRNLHDDVGMINNMTKLLGKCCPLVVTPSLSSGWHRTGYHCLFSFPPWFFSTKSGQLGTTFQCQSAL